ncbi:MAG: hypothetical protein ABI616_10290 [Pseudomonadota bacterium]
MGKSATQFASIMRKRAATILTPAQLAEYVQLQDYYLTRLKERPWEKTQGGPTKSD